jgi:hypothetical protein
MVFKRSTNKEIEKTLSLKNQGQLKRDVQIVGQALCLQLDKKM